MKVHKMLIIGNEVWPKSTPLLDRIVACLERYDFMPGTEMFVKQKMHEGLIELSLVVPVVDSNDRGNFEPHVTPKWIQVIQPSTLSISMLEYIRIPLCDLLDMEMHSLTHKFALHERDEWLRRDGERIKDPHLFFALHERVEDPHA